MNKASCWFWNNDQWAPIGAIFLLLSPVHTGNLSRPQASGSHLGYTRCRASDERDKQPTGSEWPWRRICRGTVTRQTKRESTRKLPATANEVSCEVPSLWLLMHVRKHHIFKLMALTDDTETRPNQNCWCLMFLCNLLTFINCKKHSCCCCY